MKQRLLLILSTSGGAGHLRAAHALEQAASSGRFSLRVENHDCLDFTSKVFKKLYAESYLSIVNKAPEVWGYLYQKAEQKPYTKKALMKLFDRINYKRYVRVLQEFRPDAIVCTHFLPFISISDQIRKTGFRAPFFAATTDFDVHQYWVDSIIERYYVYHEESSWQLQSKGVAKEKIVVKGIPLMPEFSFSMGRDTVRRKLNLAENNFTLLVLSGGFGIGKVEEIVHQVTVTLSGFHDREFNLLVVCGKNEKVRTQLANASFPSHVHMHVDGFVTNIHELMEASDILISKSGGLTSAEAMARSLPIMVVDPIPGQETRNADLIVEHGAGWRAINLPNLSYKLRRVIQHPEILEEMREAAASLAKPHAAHEIIEDVVHYLDEKNGGAL